MITKVLAKNFMSWADLEFSPSQGVTLIDGWNEDDQTSEGSGKSAILNAISWALYGKLPKDTNIDDVIREGEKSCSVSVVFSDGTVVQRSRKPNELDIHEQTGTEEWVSRKGKDAKETQIIIEEFVGLSFETFCQTVYFAQNYAKKFISSNQEEKGKILSEVQDLGVFDRARKETQRLLKEEEAKSVNLKHQVQVLDKDLALTQKDIEAEEFKIQSAEQQTKQKIEFLQSQIERVLTEVKLYESDHAGLTEAMAQFTHDQSKEDSIRAAIDEITGNIAVIHQQKGDVQRLVNRRATAQAQGKRAAERYKRLQADKEKAEAFIANPTKDCPTCGTTLKNVDTSHAKYERQVITADLESTLRELTELSSELDQPVPTTENLDAQIKELQSGVETLRQELRDITTNKERMLKAGSKLSQLESLIQSKTSELEKLKNDLVLVPPPNIDRSKVVALVDKLSSLKEEREALVALVLKTDKYTSQLSELKDGFKEIKSFIFNSVLNEVNARVHQYLSQLFEVPVSVRFINDNMKIETEILFDGTPRGLGLLSGGQARRVGLAVDLALSDVVTARKGSKIGLLILDEYFKDLSESSMEKCLSLLENRGQPVLLIEHNSIFKSIVTNSFVVRLENGVSRVEI